MVHQYVIHTMTPTIHSICVFCGSRMGARSDYRAAAHALGQTLALRDITLVYGGAAIGLMGVMADAALAAGGRVVGVIPRALEQKEIAHPGLSELHVVDSMHARKARMEQLSDGFVAMPGGAGTLDELFEIITWAQLGIHGKPVALFNVAGYFDKLLHTLEHMVAEGFIDAAHQELWSTARDPEDLLAALHRRRPPRPAPPDALKP
jgi:uncharacterized protein (TIGR00730 family)